jgi:hypothetical protein
MQTPDRSTWRNAHKRTSPPGTTPGGYFFARLLFAVKLAPGCLPTGFRNVWSGLWSWSVVRGPWSVVRGPW